jgi:hypothetical protein
LNFFYRFSSKDLPKVIVFKTISMQFTPTVSEIKESEEIDNTQLIRMSSADLIRLKRAHKAEKMFVEKTFSFDSFNSIH